MNYVKTDRDAENIVRDFYKDEPGVIINSQPKIEGVSKAQNGNFGRAEFIIKHENHPEIALVVECKTDIKNHADAQNEAWHYSLGVEEEHTPLLAVSGTGPVRTSMLIDDKEYEEMLPMSEVVKIILQDEKEEEKTIEEITTYAKGLHNFLRDNVALSEAQKPLLVAAIMIALRNNGFKETYEVYENEDCKLTMENRKNKDIGKMIPALRGAVANVLALSKIPDGKQEIVTKELSFIEGLDPLYKRKDENSHTVIYQIIKGLDDHLFSEGHMESDLDLLGKFYGEFIKYTGGDGSGLGIVLTPNHVTDLMCELAEVNIDSVVYDPCAGTGGFLITAMNKMIKEAGPNKDKVAYIKQHQLHGVEMNPSMYTLAVANMIFKGDGKANMANGSCFDLEPKTQTKAYTASILNPPYSQKAKGLKELDFILHACKMMERGGKVVAIVPKSVFIDKKNEELKRQLLSKHTIEAVVTMPLDLFYPVGTNVAVIVLSSHIPHPTNKEAFFYDFKNDGFKTVPKKGRIHIDYIQRRNELLTAYKNRTKTTLSSMNTITEKDEWIAEAYVDTNYSTLVNRLFIKNIAKFKAHVFLHNPFAGIQPLHEPTLELNTQEWKEFKYPDIFEIKGGNDYQSIEANENPGENNFVGSSEFNNGVTTKTSLPNTKPAGTITVAKDGSVGSAFYQSEPYSVNGHVSILKVKERPINENIGNFICTVIELEKPKYDFGRAWGQARMAKSTIKLPVVVDGSIDWNFMEEYMRQIQGE